MNSNEFIPKNELRLWRLTLGLISFSINSVTTFILFALGFYRQGMSLAPPLESALMDMQLVAGDDSSEATFMDLPLDLKFMIVKKLDMFSFCRLRGCSTDLLKTCDALLPTVKTDGMKMYLHNSEPWVSMGFAFDNQYRIYGCPDKLEWRRITMSQLSASCFHVWRLFLTKLSDWHCDMLEDKMLHVTYLCVGDIVCGAEKFNKFLMDRGVKHLEIGDYPPWHGCYFKHDHLHRLPAVTKLSSFTGRSERGATMEFILGLRATKLCLPCIDSTTINTLLKEWQSGERRIDRFEFTNVTDWDSFHHEMLTPPAWNEDMRALLLNGLHDVQEHLIDLRVHATISRPGTDLKLCLFLSFGEILLSENSCFLFEYDDTSYLMNFLSTFRKGRRLVPLLS